MTRQAEVVSLRDARERAIAQLSDAFTQDVIGVDEFDRRVTLVHRADSVSGLERVVSDLVATAPSTALASLSAPLSTVTSEHDVITAIFGGVERRGPWTPPRRLEVIAAFGGVLLDLREARFLPGATDIHVMAMMGGVQLIVPPHLSVEVSGSAILGGFAHMDRMPVQLGPERPLLRVHGRAILGGVAVETRLPGESEEEAHCRRRSRSPAFGR